MKQTIEVKPGHKIVGNVKNGHILVDDIIHDGISAKNLMGVSPALHPIPVADIEAIRKNHGINEPVLSDVK